MILRPQSLAGVWLVEPQRAEDARGHFARTFCAEVFAQQGLPSKWAQCSTSFNHRRGTLRGMHWQAAPHGEGKLVRCTRGAIFDVAVDLRPGSPTYCQWLGVELSAENGRQLYISEGFAHGFVTLEDASEVYYQITAPFVAAASRGARWNDPAFGIRWPLEPLVISDRDKNFMDFRPEGSTQ
jgi:dTDP-4-dehydrorhamnose 3,5-epimerase